MKKILAFAAMLFMASTSFAALRGTAQNGLSVAATSITVDVSAIGIQDGDVLICTVEVGGTGTATFTWPSGFAVPSGLSTINLAYIAGANTLGIAYWVVSGTVPTSVTITSSQSDRLAAQCRDYSGRNTTSPFTAVAQTGSTTLSATSPATFAMTGLTAVTGDDIVIMAGFNNGKTGSAYTYTFSGPSGYANAITEFAGTQYDEILGSADQVNAAGGATGTINSTITASVSVPPSAGGYVLAVAPAAAGSCTNSGITSAGSISIPVASSTVVQLKSGALGTVDCATVNYKQSLLGNFGVN